MKKLVSMLLALCLVLGVTVASAAVPAEEIKVGYICIGDENEGYSANHINGLKAAQEALGISDDQVMIKYNIPETEAAYEAAVDLAENGCDIIFATSFGQESYVFQAAAEYPDIQFCHATGTAASTSELTNVHNYFTAIYEARYVSGVVAGMKLNQMIEDGTITAEAAKIGYVGAFPFAEVISGYTSFFLGARSVCPSATMEVRYTNSWSDMALEKETAEALIADGCVLISQHSDTVGPATACEAAGVPIVGYNISMIPTAPTQALTSAACNWGRLCDLRHPVRDRRHRDSQGLVPMAIPTAQCTSRSSTRLPWPPVPLRRWPRLRPRSRTARCMCLTAPPSPWAARN